MKRLWFVLLLTVHATVASAGLPTEVRLTFHEALTMAHERHAQIIMADERVQQALARVGQAASNLLPHLSASVSDSRQTRDLRSQGIMLPNTQPHIGPFDSFDGRVRVTQAIFDAGALARLNAAAHGRDLSEAQSNKIKEDVLALVATLYLNARRAQDNLETARIVLKMNMKHWRLVRSQWAQGTASSLDVDVARNAYARSYSSWRQARARQTQTRVDLCAALDLPMDSSIVYADDDALKDERSYDTHRWSLNHPDIEVAKAQLSVLSAQKNAEQADWLPKVSALADYGSSGEDLGHESTTYTLGLQASFPIWEGGLRENRIREAKSRVNEGQANLDEVTRQTQGRVLTALANIEEAKAFVREAKAQWRVAQTRRKLAVERLTIGNGTPLDVLDAQAAEAVASDQMKEALTTFRLSHIHLAHALGRMHDLLQTSQSQEKL